jgi:hypothetical protein
MGAHLGAGGPSRFEILVKAIRPRLALAIGSVLAAALAGVPAAAPQTSLRASTTPAVALPDGDRQTVEHLLAQIRGQAPLGRRMKTVSAAFLGAPYSLHPLVGSLTEPERLVARLDRFDCVTFLETVLALAGATSPDGFLERLRQIRYEAGNVSYTTRLHYMADWQESNVRRGFLDGLTEGAGTVELARTLALLPGRLPHTVNLRFFPKDQLDVVSLWLQDGDLIFFVSGRKSLDIFHVALLFRDGETLFLRHAALSQGRVLDQSLADFFHRTRMLGFIVVRPVDGRVELQAHRASDKGPGAR